MDSQKLKLAALKAAIVLIPSSTAAYFTGKMLWVVPTLVAAGFFAAGIDLTKRVDEEGTAKDDEGTKDEENEHDAELPEG